MTFAAPLWLLGLIPWTVLAVWMLLRQRSTTAVPFLKFWPAAPIAPTTRPTFGRPPLHVILFLLAIALAILGSGRPARREAERATQAAISQPHARIVDFAAVDMPQPQAMVRIHTMEFDRPTVDVAITSGDTRTVRTIPVKPDDTQTVFIDLPKLAATVTASLSHGDGPSVTLTRVGRGLRVSDDAHVLPALRRMIEVYSQHRPSDQAAVIDIGASLPADRSGIVLSPATGTDGGSLTVMDDLVTRDVDWSNISGGCAVSPAWEPLVSRGNSVLIARRVVPAKQILVSVANPDWAATPGFLVFWTNALDWLAGGDGHFESVSPAWTGRLSDQSTHLPISDHDLSSVLFLSALSILLLALLFVPRRAIPYTTAHVQPLRETAHSHR